MASNFEQHQLIFLVSRLLLGTASKTLATLLSMQFLLLLRIGVVVVVVRSDLAGMRPLRKQAHVAKEMALGTLNKLIIYFCCFEEVCDRTKTKRKSVRPTRRKIVLLVVVVLASTTLVAY